MRAASRSWGRPGRLLDNMLAAIGLKRGHDVYIANIVKCRPPGNRVPEPQEAAQCEPFLLRQIELIQPEADRRAGQDGSLQSAAHRSVASAACAGGCTSFTARRCS